jgi:radical SAM protein with 4Fe4S-binding SPASM domain
MSFKSLEALLNPNKILPHYVKRGLNAENTSPVSVELHWTSNCNYDCSHCSYGSRRKTTNFMKMDVVTGLVDDLIEMKCQAVYLSGGGEPTVLKHWDRHAEKLMSNNIEVALISNGVALSNKNLPVVRKMNYVAISVYSTMEARYQKITESKFYGQQFSAPRKIKSESADIIVGARCVLNETNYDELYLIYRKAIDSGFDYIIFIPAVDYESRGIVLQEGWVDRIIVDINDNMNLFDHKKTNVRSLLKKMVSHYENDSYLDGLDGTPRGCDSISMRNTVFINYDGGVYLCQPDIGNKCLEIGNVNEFSFKKIWNSERHRKVIGTLNDRWNMGGCRNCRSIALNKAVSKFDAGTIVDIDAQSDPFL